MKYKTAFRLGIRAIGVLIAAQEIPWFLQGCVPATIELLRLDPFGAGAFPSWSWYLGNFLGHVVGFAIGAYLFFRGDWIVNLAIPSNRPYCHECAYELTGLPTEGVCPECGTPYRREGGTRTDGERPA